MFKDKRKDKAQKAYTHQNSKRHMPLVSLLLGYKMVVVCCFVWLPALQCDQAGLAQASKPNFKFWQFLQQQKMYPAPVEHFLAFN